jgi:Na+-transporting NADH:ubiquinone oxidoreductase subunit C
MWIDSEGKILSEKIKTENDLSIFFYVKQNEVISYIIPIDSRGLWGRILGYLSIENNGKTISGFTVYSHSETPGLGGEIETSWFQKNFTGKEILDDAGHFTSVTIAKGTVKGRIPKNRQKHFVDGITGATLTGRYLSEGLNRILFEYEPLSKRFRNKQIKRLKGVN